MSQLLIAKRNCAFIMYIIVFDIMNDIKTTLQISNHVLLATSDLLDYRYWCQSFAGVESPAITIERNIIFLKFILDPHRTSSARHTRSISVMSVVASNKIFRAKFRKWIQIFRLLLSFKFYSLLTPDLIRPYKTADPFLQTYFVVIRCHRRHLIFNKDGTHFNPSLISWCASVAFNH